MKSLFAVLLLFAFVLFASPSKAINEFVGASLDEAAATAPPEYQIQVEKLTPEQVAKSEKAFGVQPLPGDIYVLRGTIEAGDVFLFAIVDPQGKIIFNTDLHPYRLFEKIMKDPVGESL